MLNVRMGSKLTLYVQLTGTHPEGSTCKIRIYRGPTGDDSELVKELPVQLTSKEVRAEWEVTGLHAEEFDAPFHWTASVDGWDQPSKKAAGEFHVWVKSIKVIAHDEQGANFVGALFEVRQGTSSRLLHVTEQDGGGATVDLWDFSPATVQWVKPFEVTAWEKQTPCTFQAKLHVPPFKAYFASKPEVDAEPEDGLYKRKQYVNLLESDAAPDEGSYVRLFVGADPPMPAGVPVHIRVKLGNKDGAFCRRNSPLPRLMFADKEGEVELAEQIEPDLGKSELSSDKRPTLFTKQERLIAMPGFDEPVALFQLDCGLAGGDVFTVQIGSTPECKDAKLEITTWRRVGYHIFFPSAKLSDQGNFDGSNDLDFPAKAKATIKTELDKAFIEHTKASAVEFDTTAWPEVLPYAAFDGGPIYDQKGKTLLCLDSDQVLALAGKLGPRKKLTNEQTIVVCDHVTEVVTASPTSSSPKKHSLTCKMTSAKRDVALGTDKKLSVFPLSAAGPSPGIRALSLKLTKLKGKPLTDALKADRTFPYRAQVVGAPIWSESTDPVAAAALQKEYVEFVSGRKIRVKLPADKPGDPGKLFKDFKGVELSLTVVYELRERSCCLGMNFRGSGGTMVLPSMGGKLGLKDFPFTVVHELCHALGQAYGKAGLPICGRRQQNPGVPFRLSVSSNGYVYDGHGHQGGHCAYGLDEAMRAEADFTATISVKDILNPLRAVAMNFEPKCLNWGSAVMFRKNPFTLCPGCAAALRAQDCTDLSGIR